MDLSPQTYGPLYEELEQWLQRSLIGRFVAQSEAAVRAAGPPTEQEVQ